MFTEKILRLIAAVLVGAYVARYLGPAKFGILNYAISLTALFAAVSTLGLDQIVIRELVNNPSRKNQLLGSAFVLKLLGGLTSFLILVAITYATDADLETRLMICFIAGGAVFNSLGVIDFYFQSKVLSKYSVISQIITLVMISLLRVGAVYFEAPLLYFALLTGLEMFLYAIGLVYFFNVNADKITLWFFDRSVAKVLMLNSWPLIFSELATSIYMRFDQIMIKWLIGNEANGLYGTAVRLSEMWNFIPVAICGSLFPAILNAKVQSEELYIDRLKSLFRLMIFLSLAIAIPMTFLSSYIIELLYGKAYHDAGPILSLYIWSGVFIFIGVANGKWIITENLQRFRMVALCISGALNLILTYTLVSTIGLFGAAISSLICYAFAGYFSFLMTSKTRPMFRHMSEAFNVFKFLGSKQNLNN
jgi:O-antigen/teichoic acid export membrane protein